MVWKRFFRTVSLLINACRFKVSRTYSFSFTPIMEKATGRCNRVRLYRKVSIKIFPTKCTWACSVPVWFRFRFATIPAVNRMSDSPSVIIRLTSFGISISKERVPATRCATFSPFFLATIEQAMVGVRSSTTMTICAGCFSSSRAKATTMPAIR